MHIVNQNLKSIMGFLALCLLLAGCSSSPIENFPKVKEAMSKDEVLDILGSPNRTEYKDGKEKWAYRYWTGPNKDVEELRQISFINGKVVSFGEDMDEKKRLQDLKQEVEKKAEKRKKAKHVEEVVEKEYSKDAPKKSPPPPSSEEQDSPSN